MNLFESLALGAAGGFAQGLGGKMTQNQQAKDIEGLDLTTAPIAEIMRKTGMTYQQAVEASWGAQDRAKKQQKINVGEMFNKYNVKKKETYQADNPDFASTAGMISPQGIPIQGTVPKTISQEREVPYAPGEEELTPEQYDIEKPFIQGRIEESAPLGKLKIKEAQMGLESAGYTLEQKKNDYLDLIEYNKQNPRNARIKRMVETEAADLKKKMGDNEFNEWQNKMIKEGYKKGTVDIKGKPIKKTNAVLPKKWIVSSTTGGKHVEGSKHYTEQAFDVVPEGEYIEVNDPRWAQAAGRIESAGYKVINEGFSENWTTETSDGHLHIERNDGGKITQSDINLVLNILGGGKYSSATAGGGKGKGAEVTIDDIDFGGSDSNNSKQSTLQGI